SVQGAPHGTTKSDEHVVTGMFSSGTTATGQMGNFGSRAPVFATAGEGDSRITRNAIYSLNSAFVIVDVTQLKGVKVSQLADYIAMNTLARLKPNAPHGNAPTILGLFEGDHAQSPEGMSPWDEAFLEALYHTNPQLVMQRGIMVSRMLSHIVPES